MKPNESQFSGFRSSDRIDYYTVYRQSISRSIWVIHELITYDHIHSGLNLNIESCEVVEPCKIKNWNVGMQNQPKKVDTFAVYLCLVVNYDFSYSYL